MLTQQQADLFAQEWIAAWNAHDIGRIMDHYAAELRFTSPFIVALTGDASGTITNREGLRQYFEKALQRYSGLRFRLLAALASVRSVVLYYESVNGLLAAEYMELDEAGKVRAVTAHYTGKQDQSADDQL